MKKLLMLFAVTLLVTLSASAQKNKVVTAYNYFKYGEIDKAKVAIDEAAAHETSNGMAKTWYYRGLIYQEIGKNEQWKSLDADAYSKAYESYEKALAIEPKYEFAPEINQNILALGNQMFGQGVEYFNVKQYDKALISFEGVVKMTPNDTLAILNSAYSAEKSNNKPKAKEYYSKLISMKYNDPKIFIFLGNIYKSEGDTAQALATIKQGRQMYPADNNLVIEELNMYLASGKDSDALESLNVAIQGDPKNPSLHFAQGTVYDKLNKKDEAAVSYKKAIELKADYFDAYYNLGAMYFNEAAEMANKANELKSNVEYGKAKEKFDTKFKEAQPYLEKAHELNAADTNTMVSLKQLYARLNETTKYDAIKVKLEGK